MAEELQTYLAILLAGLEDGVGGSSSKEEESEESGELHVCVGMSGDCLKRMCLLRWCYGVFSKALIYIY